MRQHHGQVQPAWHLAPEADKSPAVWQKVKWDPLSVRRGHAVENTSPQTQPLHTFIPTLITRPVQVGRGTLFFTGSLKPTADPSAYFAIRVHNQCKRQNIKTWEYRVMSVNPQVGKDVLSKKKSSAYRTTGPFLLQGPGKALHTRALNDTKKVLMTALPQTAKIKNKEIHLGQYYGLNCVPLKKIQMLKLIPSTSECHYIWRESF